MQRGQKMLTHLQDFVKTNSKEDDAFASILDVYFNFYATLGAPSLPLSLSLVHGFCWNRLSYAFACHHQKQDRFLVRT